jgi:hypothetical protein
MAWCWVANLYCRVAIAVKTFFQRAQVPFQIGKHGSSGEDEGERGNPVAVTSRRAAVRNKKVNDGHAPSATYQYEFSEWWNG